MSEELVEKVAGPAYLILLRASEIEQMPRILDRMQARKALAEELARAIIPLIEADAVARERERCARKATSFLVGDPYNGVPLRSPGPHEIAAAIRLGDAA